LARRYTGAALLLESGQPVDVLREVGNLGLGPVAADGPHDQTEAVFLIGEGVLDASADASASGAVAGDDAPIA